MGEPNSPEKQQEGGKEAKVVPLGKPKPETIVRHKNFLERVAAINLRAKSMSRSADRFLEEELGFASSLNDEEPPLNDDEKKKISKTMDKAEDKGLEHSTEMRAEVLETLFTPKEFRKLYKEWSKEYAAKCKKNSAFASSVTEEDFLLEKGADHIYKHRNEMIRQRTAKKLDTISGKDTDQKKEKERRQKIDEGVLQFVRRSEDDLISYGKLGDGRKKGIQDDFVKIFLENGCDEKDREKILELFDDIVQDVQFAVNTNVALEATLPVMMEMAKDPTVTDEMWEQRRQEALQKKAPELAEKPPEEGVYLPYYGGPSELAPATYGTVKEMANDGGVNLRPVPGKGPDVYAINFPNLQGLYQPLVRIVYQDKSRDINKAKIYIQDPWADKDSTHDQLDGKPATAYSPTAFREAVNKQLLEYETNVDVRLKLPTNKESVNDVLTDDDMTHMAERLFGFRLNARALEKGHIELYKRFVTVLMRAEAGDASLAIRKKTMRNALDNDRKVQYIRNILVGAEGSKVMTVDTLLKQVDMEMDSEKKKEKKKT